MRLQESRKTSIRAKVEHPFLYVKRHFGYAKVRYRGLAKNTQRLRERYFGLTRAKCAKTRDASGDATKQRLSRATRASTDTPQKERTPQTVPLLPITYDIHPVVQRFPRKGAR